MQFYRKSKENMLGLNLTPLIDVVFILLIFFISSAHFTQDTLLNVQLPKASAAQSLATQQNTIEISMNALGEYSVNQQVLGSPQRAALVQAIIAAAGSFDPDTLIIIAADRNLPYEKIMNIFDVISELGYTRIQLRGHYLGGDSDEYRN